MPLPPLPPQPEEIEICKRPDGTYWQLGTGAFGTCYKGLYHGTQLVAVKVRRRLPIALPLLGGKQSARDPLVSLACFSLACFASACTAQPDLAPSPLPPFLTTSAPGLLLLLPCSCALPAGTASAGGAAAG